MLRVAAYNVNGIRAAVRRGFVDWTAQRQPDVICLQEVRAKHEDIPSEALDGYHLAYHEGNQPGRAGVAILSKEAPTAVRIGFGDKEFDLQGRYIEVDLPGLTVGSLYLPKGAADGAILESKLRFMAEFAQYTAKAIRRAKRNKREFLVCGDYNIAHRELDIKSWKTNKKSPGFLPPEREWLGNLISDGGLIDVIRQLHGEDEGPYSWWSWRGKAFDNDSGWRIDHHLASPKLAAKALNGGVDREESYAARVSDHSPVVVDYDL